MNRVRNAGITHPAPFFSEQQGLQKKAELDRYLDRKMAEWKRTIPFASHFTDGTIHAGYYRRTLIEHVWRIRLSRVSQSKAIYKIAQISPEAAKDYAEYQASEMLHDQLFIRDCEKAGITLDEIARTEPYLSTRLFEGFFYYVLEHEHPIAPLCSNYLVEYTQAKLQPAIVRSLQASLGKDMVKGQEAHLSVDTHEDHTMEMWRILSQLIFSEDDYRMVFKYVDDVQEILALFFREIYQDTVVGKREAVALARRLFIGERTPVEICMLLKVEPAASFSGTFRIPSSKPETQRAILSGTLASGRSLVFDDLRCDETATMKQGCRAIGAEIIEHDDRLEIFGVGNSPRYANRVIDAGGSAFVFRTLAALSSAQWLPLVITGDETLRRRVMSPLFEAVRDLGGNIESICDRGRAPIVNWGGGLRGGRCRLPGNVSSQLISAILFAAPLAERPVEIEVTSEVYSKPYIRQTVDALRAAGISISASLDYRYFHVEPSVYQPHETCIREDYTSASYLLGAAALYKGRSLFLNVHGESAQGEAAIIGILERFGLRISFDRAAHTLTLENLDGILHGDFEIDARDCPNLVPTLAAIGAYVQGTLRVVGGSLTRLHKASRVEAMVAELSRAGVDIAALYDHGVCDGFEVRGASSYPGGCTFSSWGDHRIFMSLFVASLRMKRPCFCSGFEGVRLSFPDFFSEFAQAGVTMSVTPNDEPAGAGACPVPSSTIGEYGRA